MSNEDSTVNLAGDQATQSGTSPPILDALLRGMDGTHHWRKPEVGNPYLVKVGEDRVPLTPEVVASIVSGKGRPLGICPMRSGASTVLFGALDLDSHRGETDWAGMQAVARKLIDAGAALGLDFIPFRSTGGRGVHLYALWDEPQDGRSVRARLTEALVACGLKNGATGGVAAGVAEVFPKAASLPAAGPRSAGSMIVLPFGAKGAALDPATLEPMPASGVVVQYSEPVPVVAKPARHAVSLSAPTGAALSRIASALDSIDPNTLGYGDVEGEFGWLTALHAVHHETGGSDEGLALIQNWSSAFTGGKNGYDDDFTQRTWAGASSEGEHVTKIHALFNYAGERGWVDPTALEGFEVVDVAATVAATAAREVAEDATLVAEALAAFEVFGVVPKYLAERAATLPGSRAELVIAAVRAASEEAAQAIEKAQAKAKRSAGYSDLMACIATMKRGDEPLTSLGAAVKALRGRALAASEFEVAVTALKKATGLSVKIIRSELKKAVKHAGGGLDKKLGISAFPYRRALISGEEVPLNHSTNYRILFEAHKLEVWYDPIVKDQLFTLDGKAPPKTDNSGVALARRAKDFCYLSGMPAEGVEETLTALANDDERNPVTTHLSTLTWDGKPRFDAFADGMQAANVEAARTAMRIFFVQACAAADGGKLGGAANRMAEPKYETVLILQAVQGATKTSGLRAMVPAALREYFKDGVTLVIGDRDTEKQALSCWIAELGELEATFSRSDVALMKSFMSRRVDEMRMPYARLASKFARRTVFVGTVNSEKILADKTGNRRYAPVSVTRVDLGWSDAEIDQLWAEAWHRYTGGEQWWPTPSEKTLLDGAAEVFERTTDIEERLLKAFDWDAPPPQSANRKTATALLDMLRLGSEQRGHSDADLGKLGETINRLWTKHGAQIVDGVLKAKVGPDWVKVNATGGKNRGYLLPPEPGHDGGTLAITPFDA